MTFLPCSLILFVSMLLMACTADKLVLTETKPLPAPLQAIISSVRPAWVGQLVTGTFACEMGNRVEINADGEKHLNLVWQGRIYKMAAVSTSTGALRFENQSDGLVWIQIPSKSMLLNAKIGRQLANECKNR